MVKKVSTKEFINSVSEFKSEPTPEELKAFCGDELYAELTRSVLFTEFVVNRMNELGFDIPDDVPLHLSLDYHFVLLYLMIEEYMKRGWTMPQPENSHVPLKESMI